MRIETALSRMKDQWRNRYSRRKILAVTVLAGIYLLLIPAFVWQKNAERDLSVIQEKSRELSTLLAEYKPIGERVESIEQKKSLTKITGITQAVDEIASTVGIKGKIKSIKGTGAGMTLDRLSEEGAEIQLERLETGEMVNLFEKIENAPMILAIKKVQIRKSFENPERLDITMTVSLFTGK